MNNYFHSLRFRMMLAFTGLLVLLGGSLMFNSYRIINNAMIDNVQGTVKETSQILNLAIAPYALQGNLSTLKEYLSELIVDDTGNDGLDYITVNREDGKMLVAIGHIDQNRPLPTSDKLEALEAGVDRGVVHIRQPLLLADNSVGYIQYGLSTRLLLSATRNSVRQGIILVGMGLVLGISLMIYLNILFAKRIGSLIRASTAISEGNYDQAAPEQGQDEISQLAHHFNMMSESIRERIRALEDSRSELAKINAILEQHQNAITDLAKRASVLGGDVNSVIRQVTEEFGSFIGTERVSVWMFKEDKTILECRDLFLQSTGQHSSGLILKETDFMDEFRALKENKYVDANNALTDPRTAGYVEAYLKPTGITSMLDVAIQAGDRQFGVLCFEHVGPVRRWHADEISFAMALADQISITFQNAMRAESAAALRNSEAYNKVLFSQSRIPLVVLEPETGRFIDCNQAAVDIYCLGERESVLGITPLDVSAPVQYDGVDSAAAAGIHINRALTQGADVFEWRHLRPDGTFWDAEVHLMSFHTGERTLLQFSLQDITARKHAEEEILRLNEDLENRVKERTKQLESVNQALAQTIDHLKQTQQSLIQSEKLASLGSLVAGVAHELNTPLGNALTMATTLEDRTREFINESEKGLKRSTLDNFVDLVRSSSPLITRNLLRASELIMSFKHVAVDQTSSQRRSFDLKDCIDEIVLTLQPQFKRTTHRIEIDVPAGIKLDSYPGPLGQVITNLTLNALIHGFEELPEGIVSIKAVNLEPEKISINISDNGRGIPKKNLPKIFDPFFTTRLGEGGSGLGLNIAYSIVTGVLGGSIEVSSKVGMGTTFIIVLPMKAPIKHDR